MYRSLGFEALALQDGAYAVTANPADYAQHRLLADTYSSLSRYQVVRTSENFQAWSLQPINVMPMAPQLGLINLFIADSTGPMELAQMGPRESFARNGLNFQVSAIGATQGTRGDSFVVSLLNDQQSVNAGQYHYETDGFRPNNDMTVVS